MQRSQENQRSQIRMRPEPSHPSALASTVTCLLRSAPTSRTTPHRRGAPTASPGPTPPPPPPRGTARRRPARARPRGSITLTAPPLEDPRGFPRSEGILDCPPPVRGGPAHPSGSQPGKRFFTAEPPPSAGEIDPQFARSQRIGPPFKANHSEKPIPTSIRSFCFCFKHACAV